MGSTLTTWRAEKAAPTSDVSMRTAAVITRVRLVKARDCLGELREGAFREDGEGE